MTDHAALIERLRKHAAEWDYPYRSDCEQAAEALSTLTASPLPGEVEKAIAEMKSPRAISHEGRAERVCALLERMAREIERLTAELAKTDSIRALGQPASDGKE